MRAVWSFWSKPYRAGQCHAWLSEFHHALAWSLSVQEASKHYSDTWLYTDDEGARLLVDQLGLPFVHVCTDLNTLDDHDPGWWALGKLHTYRLQDEPFIHIDADAFLWLPLPERLLQADILAQNPDVFVPGESFYYPERIEQALSSVNGWLPKEWLWARASRRVLLGVGCGLLGANRLDFIRYIADLAFEIIEKPANRAAMATVKDKFPLMVLLEQFLIGCCLEYHRAQPLSPFSGVTIAYLFDSGADLFNPEQAARVGYTHLIAGAKRIPAVARLLEERIRRDDPAQFERCKRVGGALMAT